MKKSLKLKTRIVNFALKYKYPSMLIGIGLLWAMSSVLLYIVELMEIGGTARYDSLPHTFWAILIYLLSGFELEAPGTIGGKVIVVFVLILGMVVIGGVTACITSDLVQNILQGTRVPEKSNRLVLNNHIVIFGSGPETRNMIRELHHPEVGTDTPIVIISREDQQIPIGDPSVYRDVYCVYGEYTDSEVLERANVANAEVAIIPSSGQDEESILTCLGVETTEETVHTITQISDPEIERHIRRTRGDEIICLEPIRLMAQATISPMVTEVYEELLTAQEEGCELYFVDAPSHFIGHSFRDVSLVLQKEQLIPVGVKSSSPSSDREGLVPADQPEPETPDIQVNPDPDYEITENDALAVIAFQKPDLTEYSP